MLALLIGLMTMNMDSSPDDVLKWEMEVDPHHIKMTSISYPEKLPSNLGDLVLLAKYEDRGLGGFALTVLPIEVKQAAALLSIPHTVEVVDGDIINQGDLVSSALSIVGILVGEADMTSPNGHVGVAVITNLVINQYGWSATLLRY